jgi:hypothetical protein
MKFDGRVVFGVVLDVLLGEVLEFLVFGIRYPKLYQELWDGTKKMRIVEIMALEEFHGSVVTVRRPFLRLQAKRGKENNMVGHSFFEKKKEAYNTHTHTHNRKLKTRKCKKVPTQIENNFAKFRSDHRVALRESKSAWCVSYCTYAYQLQCDISFGRPASDYSFFVIGCCHRVVLLLLLSCMSR